MPEVHANLSPSAAERWMTCPGSVILSEGMPSATSPHAAEGTRAHSLAEGLLTGDFDVITRLRPPQEMLLGVQVYVDHVRSLAKPGTVLRVEQRVAVSGECWGTADAIVWDPESKTLHVIDLKYGAGVGVEVEGNLQLRIYALAALLTTGYPAAKVTNTIVQPRFSHSAGPIRSVTFDAVDLLDFHADLSDAALRVKEASRAFDGSTEQAAEWIATYIKASEKGCKWCLAAPKCPLLRRKASDLAKQVFAPEVPYDPQALAETLVFLPILEGWIKNTREFAYREAEAGKSIPNHKIVEKRATAKWKDNVDPATLAKLIGVETADVLKPVELKSVTDIKAMTPGKNDKERMELLAGHLVKESTGHVLVHESDKRPAVNLSPAAVFTPTDTIFD